MSRHLERMGEMRNADTVRSVGTCVKAVYLMRLLNHLDSQKNSLSSCMVRLGIPLHFWLKYPYRSNVNSFRIVQILQLAPY